MKDDLHVLAWKYGTDKGDGNHTVNGRSYLDAYAVHLPAYRESAETVLEMGVLNGGSLRMWRDYFPRAQIWGLDHAPERRVTEKRIQTVIGEQDDPQALALVAKGGDLDIVIDDACHWNEPMLASFKHLWPRVRKGGLYVFEDLGCSYGEFCGHQNDRALFDEFFNGIIHTMDNRGGDAAFISFWPMICFVGKA